jgi:hypothetical protein
MTTFLDPLNRVCDVTASAMIAPKKSPRRGLD